MPAALDLDPIGGWEAVKVLAMQIGPREAARKVGLNENAVLARSAREGWMRDIPRSEPLPKTMLQPAIGAIAPSVAMGSILSERNNRTRLGHSAAAANLADKFGAMDGDELLQVTPALLQAGRHAAGVFGWQNGVSPAVNINIGSLRESVEITEGPILEQEEP